MENKKTAKRGINFIDIIILLLIVAAVAGAIWLFGREKAAPSGSGATITYELQMNNVIEEIAFAAQIGDSLTETKTKAMIGTIKDVRVEPMIENSFDATTGTMKKATYPGRYRVSLVCESPAQRVSEKIVISGFTMGIGTTVDFKSKHFAGESYCTAMNIATEEAK